MNRFIKLFLVSLTTCSCTISNFQSLPNVNNLSLEGKEYKTDEIIIKINKNFSIEELNKNFNVLSSENISSDLNIYKIKVSKDNFVSALNFYKKNQAINFAEPNYIYHLDFIKDPPSFFEDWNIAKAKWPLSIHILGESGGVYTPNDPLYGQQWHIAAANIDKAWTLTRGNKNITVAVIDSGVDPNHPDLKPYLLSLKDIWDEDQGADIYNDGSKVYNYTGKDGNGHGTHITGIIAAQMDNGQGVAGVSGGGVTILPIKSTDYRGDTVASTLTKAIQYAVSSKVNIINVSIGGPASEGSQALQQSIRNAIDNGIPVISATGNESDRSAKRIEAVAVPAAYTNVIAVAASTQFNKVANYSNGGIETIITAPGGGSDIPGEGVKIFSTWPTYPTFTPKSGPYDYMAGTSMACPVVTGVVALMLSLEPYLTPAQIRNRLIVTADDIETQGYDDATGYGLINAYKALTWKTHDGK